MIRRRKRIPFRTCRKTGCTPPLRNSINRSASKHYSVFIRSSGCGRVNIVCYIEFVDSYCLTGYVPKSTVPSACPQYGVRRLARASLPSIVACCVCGAVVRCRTSLLSSPIVCVGSQPVASLPWLGIEVRPPVCPLFCSFSAFICSL